MPAQCTYCGGTFDAIAIGGSNKGVHDWLKCAEGQNKRFRETLETIAKRVNDMPLRTRNDYEAGEKQAYQWCADHALEALNPT